jgi:cell fate regulator YaaT (PSP1 superfamily)
LAVFGKPRYLGLVNIEEAEVEAGRWILVRTLRGLEMALLGGTLSKEQEAKYRRACSDEPGDEHTRGPEPMLQEVELVETAAREHFQENRQLHQDEDRALIRGRQLLQSHELQMKLVDVEYMMDRKKLFFYFTAEQRVDFRAYVRDLAREFRTRIEMRQIGVRDEAKTARGVSPCGRPCCCGCWLHRFTPINIRMVKEQNLALNPTKISGICGRLMCCMAYEQETYSELWRRLPSPGAKIRTDQGNYVLEGVDLRTESVKIRFPEGQEVAVPIADFALFKETVQRGETWEKTAPETPRRSPFSSGSLRIASVKSRALSVPVRRLKPEKISIEEHIAGRLAEKAPEFKKVPEPKMEGLATVAVALGEARFPEKRHGRRADGPSYEKLAQPTHERPAREREKPGKPAPSARETGGQTPRTVFPGRERSGPPTEGGYKTGDRQKIPRLPPHRHNGGPKKGGA